MRAVAIAGATGLTGQEVLNRLLDDGSFQPVVAFLRKPLLRSHPRLRERIVDFADLPPVPIDLAFCCLGTTIGRAGSRDAFRTVDHDYVLNFARWARDNGARHFLFVSSVAADVRSPNFYLRVKAETELDLESLGFHWLDIFQPSFLLGNRADPRPAERLGQTLVQAIEFVLVGSLERFRGISAATLAQAMLARVAHPGPPGVRRHEWRAIQALTLRRQEDPSDDIR